MKFYLAKLVMMKFSFLALLLVEREERHIAEAGQERRKTSGIIGFVPSKQWPTSRVGGSSGLKARQMDHGHAHSTSSYRAPGREVSPQFPAGPYPQGLE